jgi:hypothetical protein
MKRIMLLAHGIRITLQLFEHKEKKEKKKKV